MLLVATATMAACMPSEPAATTAMQLARDAEPLLSLCHTRQSIDQSLWPPSLITLGAKSVYIGHEGLYIETDRFYVQEAGVFVPCDRDKFVPREGEDPMFTKVANGIFTYFIAG